MKKSKKCVLLHVRGELAKNSTQTKKWKKCWVIYVPKVAEGPELGGSRNRRILRNWRNRRNVLFFTSEENSQRIPQTRNRRNVESYVPKLAQGPEVGIRLGVLSFQYKHWWDFSYKSFRGWKNCKTMWFLLFEIAVKYLPKTVYTCRKHLYQLKHLLSTAEIYDGL